MADNSAGQIPPGNDGLQPSGARQPPSPPESPNPPADNDVLEENDSDTEEDPGPRVFSMFEILLLCVLTIVVTSVATSVLRSYTNQHWGLSLGASDWSSQKSRWDDLQTASGSQSSPPNWHKINSAPGALESFSYDSIRDRVLRYVTSTRKDRASRPTIDVATYVRQQAEDMTSAPFSSLPKHLGDRAFHFLEPKVTAGVSRFGEWIANEVKLLKSDKTSPISKDNTPPRKPSPAGDLAAYTTKVVEEIKVLEAIASRAINSPSKLKLPRPFSVEDLEAYASKIREDISNLGDEVLKALPVPHKGKTSQDYILKRVIEASKEKLSEKIKRISEKLIAAPVAQLESAASQTKSKIQKPFSNEVSPAPELRHMSKKTKENSVDSAIQPKKIRETKFEAPKSQEPSKDTTSEVAPETIPTRSKGGYERWWSGFRLSAPPTSTPIETDAAKHKIQKTSKTSTSVTIPWSSTIRSKGAHESRWSEFRLQGPPTMTSLSESQQIISLPALESETTPVRIKKKKIIKEEKPSPSEKYTSLNLEDTTTSAKIPKASKKKTQKKKDVEVTEKSRATKSKLDPVSDIEDRQVDATFVSSETATKLSWFEKLAGKIDVPKQQPTEISVPGSETLENPVEYKHSQFSSERSSQPSRDSVMDSTPKVAEVTTLSFLELLRQGGRRLQHPAESGLVLEKVTPPIKTITVEPFLPSPQKKLDKSKSKTKTTITNLHPVIVPVNPSSGEFVPSADSTKMTDASTSLPDPTSKNAAGALVGYILKALKKFSFSTPVDSERQSWKEWAWSFFDFSGLKQRIVSLQTKTDFWPSVFMRKSETDKIPGQSWWTSLVNFTRLERDRVRNETPKDTTYEDEFFDSPSYQHRSAKNKTAEAILEISGTLYSVIDQLMAEGNQHFENQTRLQGAWDGIFYAEAVMNSSQIFRTVARDVDSRNLLKSYNGVVHKFARLVSDIAEATDRITVSPVVTEADVRHWKTMKWGFNKFLRDVRSRPFFSDRELLVCVGFHRDILIGGRDKLENAKYALERLTGSRPA